MADMKTTKAMLLTTGALLAIFAFAGCGSSSGPSTNASTVATTPPTLTAPATSTATPTGSQATGSTPGGLAADAAAAATGDIPDNQAFVTFQNAAAGYSIKHPEGWSEQGGGARVTISDKNNIVRIVVASGSAPTIKQAQSDVAQIQAKSPGAQADQPSSVQISGTPAIKVTYTTLSQPNQVTGKRVTLAVDRYYLANAGKVAVVDLGTPKGVDNVDGYRLMIESFTWR